MGRVLSLEDAIKSLVRSQVVLSDSALQSVFITLSKLMATLAPQQVYN